MGSICSSQEEKIDLKLINFKLFSAISCQQRMEAENLSIENVAKIILRVCHPNERAHKYHEDESHEKLIRIEVSAENESKIINEGFFMENIKDSIRRFKRSEFKMLKVIEPSANKKLTTKVFKAIISAIFALDRVLDREQNKSYPTASMLRESREKHQMEIFFNWQSLKPKYMQMEIDYLRSKIFPKG